MDRKLASLAFLMAAAASTATNVMAAPSSSHAVAGRSNSGKSAAYPWPSVPAQQSAMSGLTDGYVCPVAIVQGLSPNAPTNVSQSSLPVLKLTNVGDTYTVDYGKDVAGKPTFEITSFDGPYAQIEVKYTESYEGLFDSRSDGPYFFANGLANSFRVETFNVTSPGRLTSYFIQGSQRWQSIKLVSGANLTINTVGFVPTTDNSPASTKAGYFASSNEQYTDIWNLAINTQELACFQPGTQTSTWDITENGAYIRGQRWGSATGEGSLDLSNYTMSFDTMIDYGGTGWRVDTQIDSIVASGPYLFLTSEYPEGSFANIDRELLPPNTLVLGSGWSLQNQTSLPGYYFDKFPIPFNVTEKTWHNIETDSLGQGLYKVRLDGHEIASFNLTSYGGNALPFYIQFLGPIFSSFGFGPWQDQAAWVRNVNVTKNGQTVYSNPMTSSDVLLEYGVHTNVDAVCSDAGKRDRYSWLGDRLHSSRAIAISTAEYEYITGSADQAFKRQLAVGAVPINSVFSPVTPEGVVARVTGVEGILLDYQLDFMRIIYEYWLRSGDADYIRSRWADMRAVVSFVLASSLDPVTNLFKQSCQTGNPMSSSCSAKIPYCLQVMSEMATFMNDTNTATLYSQQRNLTLSAINNMLWNQSVGAYVDGIGSDSWGLTDLSLAILAGVADEDRQKALISNLPQLKVKAGYKNSTLDISGQTQIEIDPYYESFLLEALAVTGQTNLAEGLLIDSWGPMTVKSENYTGALWEYVSEDGTWPGLGLFTAQSHFWGAYSTVFLTEYILGVRPTTPGYAEFLFAPLPHQTGSTWNEGRVPTPYGPILAAWGMDNGKLVMSVTPPKGTTGTVVPPVAGTYTVDGKKGQSGSFTVTGHGKAIEIRQE